MRGKINVLSSGGLGGAFCASVICAIHRIIVLCNGLKGFRTMEVIRKSTNLQLRHAHSVIMSESSV